MCIAAEEVNTYPKTVDMIIASNTIIITLYKKTTDRFKSQLSVNYLSYFLFLNLLLKKMLIKGKRIVITISNAY